MAGKKENKPESRLKKYDLHIHTTFSPCSMNSPKTILQKAKEAGLDGIAITDHNTTKGAYAVKKINKDKNFEIIIGEEVKTDCGDVIALYIKKDIPPGPLFEVLKNIKKQGGISIVAHPFRHVPWLRFKYDINKLEGKIDAIEVFNSRNLENANKLAEKAVANLDFARTGSSDAHIPQDIGKGYTLFHGNLIDAIKTRSTHGEGTTRYGLVSSIISTTRKRIISPFIKLKTIKNQK